MNTCETCKWWNPIDHSVIQARCQHPLLNNPTGKNDSRGACVGRGIAELPNQDEFVIFTAMKFGCIHHEPK